MTKEQEKLLNIVQGLFDKGRLPLGLSELIIEHYVYSDNKSELEIKSVSDYLLKLGDA